MSDPTRRPPIPLPHPKLRVLGPSGRVMTAADLPPADTQRWVVRRKAEVVAGVRAGLLTVEAALRRYGLSEDELQSWERHLDKFGTKGLRVTRTQHYRAADPGAQAPPVSQAGKGGQEETGQESDLYPKNRL